MTPRPNDSERQPSPHKSRGVLGGPPAWVAAAVLAICIGVVYGRALDAPLIFDDDMTIVSNESIFSLWPLVGTTEHPGPLRTQVGRPTSGRPLVNLSFALNYYFGGPAPVGYHFVNVLIHFGTALLLWAIVVRTLRLSYFAGRFDSSAGWLALVVALSWALHPLQTEAVIYATQRTELMMAFCYLATLCCSLHYWATNARPAQHALWLALAVFACLAGMASKEVMVSAPLMVLLFERTFISGSLANALRRSWPLYVGLALTWLLLLFLNIGAPRGDTAGIGLGPSLVAWWLTQSQVLLMYLKLVVWPSPLLVHYLLPYHESIAAAWMYVLPVILLGIATLALLWRNHPIGYLGTWMFAVLSATSVVPILTETAAERRMYLPLAALVVLFVIGGYVLAQSLWRRWAHGRRATVGVRPLLVTVVPALLLATVFGVLSARRLSAYYDTLQLWQDVVQDQPANYIAHLSLGVDLWQHGRSAEAIDELHEVLQLKPDYAEAHSDLGNTLIKAGRVAEGITELEIARTQKPDNPFFLNNLGIALMQSGRAAEGIQHLQHAVQLKPDYAQAHNSLGLALAGAGKVAEATEQYNEALQINPNYAKVHYNLGNLLAGAGDMQNAIAHFELAVGIQPELNDAQYKLALALTQAGQPTQAIEHYEAALRSKPGDLQAYASLAQTLAILHRPDQAVATAEKGIEAARSTGQHDELKQFEDWLKDYRAQSTK